MTAAAKAMTVILGAGRRALSMLAGRRRGRERAARAALGMAARHPERITSSPCRADARLLAAVMADLWPHDEYVQIVRDNRREDR